MMSCSHFKNVVIQAVLLSPRLIFRDFIIELSSGETKIGDNISVAITDLAKSITEFLKKNNLRRMLIFGNHKKTNFWYSSEFSRQI